MNFQHQHYNFQAKITMYGVFCVVQQSFAKSVIIWEDPFPLLGPTPKTDIFHHSFTNFLFCNFIAKQINYWKIFLAGKCNLGCIQCAYFRSLLPLSPKISIMIIIDNHESLVFIQHATGIVLVVSLSATSCIPSPFFSITPIILISGLFTPLYYFS